MPIGFHMRTSLGAKVSSEADKIAWQRSTDALFAERADRSTSGASLAQSIDSSLTVSARWVPALLLLDRAGRSLGI
jgi:hypothetical protein